jgi:hypothetical protein
VQSAIEIYTTPLQLHRARRSDPYPERTKTTTGQQPCRSNYRTSRPVIGHTLANELRLLRERSAAATSRQRRHSLIRGCQRARRTRRSSVCRTRTHTMQFYNNREEGRGRKIAPVIEVRYSSSFVPRCSALADIRSGSTPSGASIRVERAGGPACLATYDALNCCRHLVGPCPQQVRL